MCHPKLHLLNKDSCDHHKGQLGMKYFKRPQTLGSGHWFFSAFKIPLEVIPKSQPSRATISEPSFFNSGTSDSQIIVSGTFFDEKSYMGVNAQRFFLSQSGCLLDACTRAGSELVRCLAFRCLRSQQSDQSCLYVCARYPILMRVHSVPSKATPIEKGLL